MRHGETETACIEYQGAHHVESGYGICRFNGRTERAHRVTYCKAHGLTLDDIRGLHVRHLCDNPPCVNPDHLLLGTHADNMRDKQTRGRGNQPKGECNAKAKLTAKSVQDVRARAKGGASNRALAREFGVSPSTIARAVNRQKWRHVE